MTATSAGAYEANWYAGTIPADPECRVLASDLDVDVCVVGGEIAGLTVAYALARRGWSVAVLERERIADGGMANGAGIVAPGFCESPEGIVVRVGTERAKALWELSAAGVERVRETIGAAGLGHAAAPQPGLLQVERADREAVVQRRVDLIGGTFGIEAEYWPSAQVREVLRSGRLHQAVHFPRAFHIQPLHYALGLAAAARSLGVRIYECTPVQRVDAFGIRKQVDAVGWRVRARHIVLAGSGDLGSLHAGLAGTVLSLSYPVGVTAPLGERLAEAVRFAGAAVSGPAAGSHRIVGGDRLMWAGPLTTRRKPPRRLARQIGRAVLRTYPQLAGLVVEHVWHAHADYTAHRMPQIGELAPGLWLTAAFGHHGMATAAMAGDLIAHAILEGDDRWRLFRSYGLVWTGGVVGRAIVGAALSFSQARAVLRERKTSARIPPVEEPVSTESAAAPEADVSTAEVATVAAPMTAPPAPEPSAAAEPATDQAAAVLPADETASAQEPATKAPATEPSAIDEPALPAALTDAPIGETPLAVAAPEIRPAEPADTKEGDAAPAAAKRPKRAASGEKKPRAPRQKKPQGERTVRTKRRAKAENGEAESQAAPEAAAGSEQPKLGDTPSATT